MWTEEEKEKAERNHANTRQGNQNQGDCKKQGTIRKQEGEVKNYENRYCSCGRVLKAGS